MEIEVLKITPIFNTFFPNLVACAVVKIGPITVYNIRILHKKDGSLKADWPWLKHKQWRRAIRMEDDDLEKEIFEAILYCYERKLSLPWVSYTITSSRLSDWNPTFTANEKS